MCWFPRAAAVRNFVPLLSSIFQSCKKGLCLQAFVYSFHTRQEGSYIECIALSKPTRKPLLIAAIVSASIPSLKLRPERDRRVLMLIEEWPEQQRQLS